MTPNELAKLRKQVLDLERVAKADPSLDDHLRAARDAYTPTRRRGRAERATDGAGAGDQEGPRPRQGLRLGDDD